MRTFIQSGYFLEPTSGAETHSVIGGFGPSSPVSPNSGRPLLQLAALDLIEMGLSPSDWVGPSIKLLYSWTCAISEGRFTYRCLEEGIQLLEAQRGDAYDDFPYPHYPDAFREVSVALVALTADEQNILRKINLSSGDEHFDLISAWPDLAIPRHQVGGEPLFLSKHAKSVFCPVCNQEMLFLASIGNKTFRDTLGFAGNDFVQVVYHVCPECRVLSARNFAD